MTSTRTICVKSADIFFFLALFIPMPLCLVGIAAGYTTHREWSRTGEATGERTGGGRLPVDGLSGWRRHLLFDLDLHPAKCRTAHSLPVRKLAKGGAA